MLPIYGIVSLACKDLGEACKVANYYKSYYLNHGYENVLFTIRETNLKGQRFIVEFAGRKKKED